MKSAVKKDILFIGVCLLIMISAGVMLYADMTREIDRGSTKVIGKLTLKKRIAERKFTSQVLWSGIDNDSPVYNYDTIRTDEDSLAVVNLNDGTEVELNQNTLVVLSMREKFLDISLESGALAAKKGYSGSEQKDESEVRISSGDSDVSIADGELLVTRDREEGIKVDVTSGSASVKVGDRETVVSENQAVEIGADGSIERKEAIYKTVSPLNSSIFIFTEERTNIEFSWTGSGVRSGSAEVIISTDPLMQKKVRRFKADSGSSLKADLAAGTYFWRIEAPDGESNVSRFTLLRDKAAAQVFPRDKESFRYTGDKPMINFQWVGADHSGSYIVEVFTDPGLDKKEASLASSGTSIASDMFSEGKYYWRVKNVYGGNIRSGEVVSGVRSFEVVRLATVRTPVPEDGTDGQVMSQLALGSGKAFLKWSPASGADEYVIEVSRDSNFTDIAASHRTRYNYYIPPGSLGKGKYYWRIAGLSGDMQSAFSETGRFTIEPAVKIETISPQDKTRIYAGMKDMTFIWKDPNNGSAYMFEISGSESFSDIVVSERTTGRQIEHKLPDPGNYFWRVFLIDKSGQHIATSDVSGFSVYGKSPSPVIIQPAAESILNKYRQDNISFTWKPDKGSSYYRLSIYFDKAGKKETLYSGIVNRPKFIFEDLPSMRETDYTWEVTGLQYKGDEYIAVTDVSRGSFSVTAEKSISVPKIRLPRVLILQ